MAVGFAACEEDRSPVPEPEPAPVVEELARTTSEEIEGEIQTLEFEIADLEIYIETQAEAVAVVDSIDPRKTLAEASSALASVSAAVVAGDTAAALDSLEAAAGRVERVKRSLGVAEELGVEFDPPEDTSAASPAAAH